MTAGARPGPWRWPKRRRWNLADGAFLVAWIALPLAAASQVVREGGPAPIYGILTVAFQVSGALMFPVASIGGAGDRPAPVQFLSSGLFTLLGLGLVASFAILALIEPWYSALQLASVVAMQFYWTSWC
ncbi:MAG: hypothetical protein U0800_16605 [Isosphaeraceae bacterium]